MPITKNWTNPAEFSATQFVVSADMNLMQDNLLYLYNRAVRHASAFPGSPDNTDIFFHTTFRAFFFYNINTWRQLSIGSFVGSNPASPPTGLLIYRSDLGRVLRYDGSSWVSIVTPDDIPNLDTSKLTSGQLAVARGGTGADLSATGGAGQVLKQSSTGAAVTVEALVASDIPNLDAAKITSGQLASARGGVPSGTAFPSSPAAGERFFRTDTGFEYFYDGSRWLTTCEFVVPIVGLTQYSANADTPAVLVSATDTFRITRITMSTYVATTNNGSNYWNVALQGVNDAFTAFTVISTANTSAQSANTFVRSAPTASDPQLASGRAALRLGLTKTGSPGDLRIMLSVHYRFVIT